MSSKSLLVLQVFFAVGVLQSRSDPPVGIECKKDGNKPNCVCHHPNGTIDLTALSSAEGPRFNGTNFVDTGGFRYYYNPCHVFSLMAGCPNIYACQEASDGSAHYPLANENTEKMYYDVDKDETSVVLYYSAPAGEGNIRETRVQLICDISLGTGQETITTTGDSETELVYKFTLTTCHACPGGCQGHRPKGSGDIAGPIGLTLIFLFIIAVLAYFIIGAVIMQVRYQKAGVELIPNKGFWFVLPVLIKDGFMLTISPCMRMLSKEKYEQI